MKKLFLPFFLTLLLAACAKKDTDIIFNRDFCANSPELLADGDIEVAFENQENAGWYFAPNCFTPNGDGINDRLVITMSYNDNGAVSSFESFKVFNQKARLIAESNFFGWDGKKENKEAKEGEYAYEAVLKLPDNRLAMLKGAFLLVRDCFDKEYDIECLTFPDQAIHPRLGFEKVTSSEPLLECK